jgi:hypothetical protein
LYLINFCWCYIIDIYRYVQKNFIFFMIKETKELYVFEVAGDSYCEWSCGIDRLKHQWAVTSKRASAARYWFICTHDVVTQSPPLYIYNKKRKKHTCYQSVSARLVYVCASSVAAATVNLSHSQVTRYPVVYATGWAFVTIWLHILIFLQA